ncbi:PaaI family thioesterase [Parasporobacterium paucivorans]|uniref:Acyl-CoA thioesterase n=1 Tax=Parasporobacterium paucivorans DSM 15970 TaxID=1122934 RepID=A0A1M6C1M2_9FIRM|nr:PaaI family thioesterase [Parasporobacterium paucivorans]SHI54935.1 acyl-CoA thioesterase [Parasporobacterium paucivorans DSM 15970]
MTKEDYIKRINETGTFIRHNHMRITDVGEDYAQGEMELTDHLLNHYSSVHGGALFALADTVAGVAATSRKTVCVTLSANINYFKGASSGKITATAKMASRTSRTAIFEVELTNEKGELLAKSIYTYYDTKKPFERGHALSE